MYERMLATPRAKAALSMPHRVRKQQRTCEQLHSSSLHEQCGRGSARRTTKQSSSFRSGDKLVPASPAADVNSTASRCRSSAAA